MSDLTTTYVALKLGSPVIAGSAGVTETVERMKKAEDNGAGMVVSGEVSGGSRHWAFAALQNPD